MSSDLADLIDLRIAWKRFKMDLAGRVFVQHPFELQLIESDITGWLEQTLSSVRNGLYKPKPVAICDVPKGNAAVRPGAHFRIVDSVMFSALVGACFPQIHRALQWSQGTIDFSYLLAESPDDEKWITSEFKGWKDFQEETIRRIDVGSAYVVFTDITGYYENVDLGTLMSDIREAGVPRAVQEQLSLCLNHWGHPLSRGIPQGHSPSDILGKLYLDSVDAALNDQDVSHIRYVDDFRIFCASEAEAKRALLELTRLLRRRGLTLQTSKTEILDAASARAKIESLRSTLLEIRGLFFAEIEMALELGDNYLDDRFSPGVLNDDLDAPPDDAPLEVITQAYSKHFFPNSLFDDGTEEVPLEFDHTLFHFLLNKLKKFKHPFASQHCITLLADHPEETRQICNYLERLGTITDFDAEIYAFLTSPDAVYPYQVYQIIEWRLLDCTAPAPDLLTHVRRLTFESRDPPYLQSVCRKFLAAFGSKSDLERLEASYADVHGELEQCEILCCLSRMERNRRNSILGRYGNDSPLHARAAKMVRTGQFELVASSPAPDD